MGDFDFKVINAEAEIQHMIDEIKRYFVENGNKDTKAVIGISGGKDSTIAAALLVRALGPERVFGVLMPDGDQKDIKDSVAVCEALHIPYRVHNIGPVTKMFAGMIGDAYNKPIVNTNTPARIRMATLYAVAADIGGRVINTGNASELYVGYTTKYGDLAGDFAILKDYYVREILEISSKDNVQEKIAKKRFSANEKSQLIDKLTKEMRAAAKLLEFEHAAYLRDQIEKIKNS